VRVNGKMPTLTVAMTTGCNWHCASQNGAA